VTYKSRGISTPHLVNNMGHNSEEIDGGNMEDNMTYAVVHASSNWLSLDTLEEEFAAPFELGDVGDCLYIVDVKCIIAPLFVLCNGNETTKVCMLPHGIWNRFCDKCLGDE